MTDNNLTLENRLKRMERAPKKLRLAIGMLAAANLVVPIAFSYYDYSITELVLSMILLDVCLYPTFRYFLRPEGLPVLPMLCLAFAVQYALPIFTQEPGIQVVSGFHYLDEADIIVALMLSIGGVCALQVAYYSLNYRKGVNLLPHISLPLHPRKAEMFCVLLFLLSLLLGQMQTVLTSDTLLQFSAIINLVHNQVLVAIGILAWLVFTGRGSPWRKVLLYVVVSVAAFKGFVTTMLESMMVPIAVFFIAKWFYTRRLPLGTLAAIGLLFLFLSPVKKNIRGSITEERELSTTQASATNRSLDWTSQAVEYWYDAFSGRRDLAESTADASSRTDLIHTFAHIYSLTPAVVPYQYGETYRYLAIAWIPRLIWPEKPQANAANDFFAVAYEISTEDGIKTSSFGATIMGEGYINFGVVGVIGIMIVLGVVLSLLEDVFAGREAGPGGQAIFLAIFVYFLNGIGSSAELMFGGLVQNLIASCILLWWVREKPVSAKKTRMTVTDGAVNKALAS